MPPRNPRDNTDKTGWYKDSNGYLTNPNLGYQKKTAKEMGYKAIKKPSGVRTQTKSYKRADRLG